MVMAFNQPFRAGSPRTEADLLRDPSLLRAEKHGVQLTKGQADAVRVKFFNHEAVDSRNFSPEQVAWGQTVNAHGFGHKEGPPDVGKILNEPATFQAPSLGDGFGQGASGGDALLGLLSGLLLLQAIKPPDPIPPPNAPPAVPAQSSVLTGANNLVNSGNTSGGIGSTILTDPVSRAKRGSSSGSTLLDPIFGSALTFGA